MSTATEPSRAHEERERPAVRRVGRSSRVSVTIAIDAASEHTFWADLALQVEQGGVFVATHQPMLLGTVVDLELTLPGIDEPLAIGGVVRWTRPHIEGSDGSTGVGIKFVDLPEEMREHVALFTRTVREPIVFELDEVPMRASRAPRRASSHHS